MAALGAFRSDHLIHVYVDAEMGEFRDDGRVAVRLRATRMALCPTAPGECECPPE